MYIKSEYINAINDAIDFIESGVDGASEEHNEANTLTLLREILKKMEESQYKQYLNYYIKKGKAKRNK